MKGSIVRVLVAADLYRYRWMIVGSILAGLVAIAVATRGGLAYGIGGIAFITNLVVLGAFIGMYSVVQERKDRATLFVLSLPVSTRQYATAKFLSSSVTFLVPWVLLSAVVILAILATDIPNGVIPTNVALLLFFLSNFYVFLTVVMSVTEEKWIVTAIIATNMSVSLFVSSLRLIPSIAEHALGPAPVWAPAVLAIIAAEALIIMVALGLTFYVQSKKRDFV